MSELVPHPDPDQEELSVDELETVAGGSALSDLECQTNCSGNCGC